MSKTRFAISVCVIAYIIGFSSASGQDSVLKKTLNFRDITTTNINQKVEESEFRSEKKIEFGDYDNDGDLDVAISVGQGDFGQRRNKLYRNDGGVLNEVSGEPIIPEFELLDVSRSVMFEDFDQDGFLDIIISNDSNSGTSTNMSPGKTKFLRNVNGEFFVNESERLDGLTGPAGDAVAADLDGNGLIDVVMTNHPNQSQDTMVLNGIDGQPAGQFTEVTNTNLPVDSEYGGQIYAADMNGDGLLDLLIGNSIGTRDFIYFNNNQNAGAGPGDFRYGGMGETQLFQSPGHERMMVPADFDNDGRMDFYYANIGPSFQSRPDQIRRNLGNNASNVPIFATTVLQDDLTDETNRVEVGDLDGDGRTDVVVVSEMRRPYILRNTTENGEISFLEWTPFEFNTLHEAWGVGIGDVLGGGSTNVMIGAMFDDFLFEKIPSPSFQADDLSGGQLPEFLNLEPIQVVGEVGSDDIILSTELLPASTRLSILLRSAGDLTLTASDGVTTVVSDRPGHASDEAIQIDLTAGRVWQIRVELESLAYDGNGDGLVNLLDVPSFVDCLTGASDDCEMFDVDDDGQLTLLDVSKFVDRLTGSPVSESFSLEVLARID